ncbi:MAG: energy-coupling factor transporter transmembrane protein EcfT [Clostridia bacterium]|nr:energy-coupling factor transporter transmembrane protein EcfT [Clostridia bacterium]
MISDITIGQYYKAESFIHKLDARAKIILTVLFIALIFLCKNFISLALTLVMVILSVLLSSVPVKMYIKSLKPIIPIVLFTAVLNMFYTGGENVVFSFKGITLTSEGIFTAIFLAARIVLLIIASSILTYTTVPTMLTDAIEKLLSPLKLFKVPVQSWAMMMTLALRFIPTLIEEIEKITNAQKSRGADFESGRLLQRIKAVIPIIIPLFVSSFRRASDLAYAMSCRCYTGADTRTRMKQMKMRIRDFVCIIIFITSIAGVILLNNLFGAVI